MYNVFSTAELESSVQNYVIFFSKYFLRQDLNDGKVLQERILTGNEFQVLVPEKAAKLDLNMSIRVLGIRYFSD
jgi:hypothetical protein